MEPKLSSDMARSCVPVGILLSAEGMIEKPEPCLQKTHSRNILTSVGFQACACHFYCRSVSLGVTGQGVALTDLQSLNDCQ